MWLHLLVDGASNLLWLSSEQIIKILLLQKEIEQHSNRSANLSVLHDHLDKQGKELGHDVRKLIQKINQEYPDLDISRFERMLKKLQEYFYRRYVVHSGSSVSLLMLDEIDEFYFLLRSKVHAEVGLGTIDEIYIRRKHGWEIFPPAFTYAYQQNNHFKPRKHKEISLLGSDGKTYKECGE